jgi:hypothetical protein
MIRTEQLYNHFSLFLDFKETPVQEQQKPDSASQHQLH